MIGAFGIPAECHLEAVYPEKYLPGTTKANEPKAIYAAFKEMRRQPVERFVVVLLDRKNAIIGAVQVAQGGQSECCVDPRDVFHTALIGRAAAIILLHNHPSGDPHHSEDDLRLTKRLLDGAKILNVTILDHIIVGRNSYSSLKELGLM
jgi:DNA repair protein RadC